MVLRGGLFRRFKCWWTSNILFWDMDMLLLLLLLREAGAASADVIWELQDSNKITMIVLPQLLLSKCAAIITKRLRCISLNPPSLTKLITQKIPRMYYIWEESSNKLASLAEPSWGGGRAGFYRRWCFITQQVEAGAVLASGMRMELWWCQLDISDIVVGVSGHVWDLDLASCLLNAAYPAHPPTPTNQPLIWSIPYHFIYRQTVSHYNPIKIADAYLMNIPLPHLFCFPLLCFCCKVEN